MKANRNRIRTALVAVLLTIAAGSCSDVNKQSAPVTLVVTTTQNLHKLDLAGGTGCNQSIGTVNISAVQIQGASSTFPPNPLLTPADLNVVKIDRYRVSYVRIDGGHLVPAPFVRSVSFSVQVGSSGQAETFVAFDPNAFNQAPFAALLPQNGGRDPETGKSAITMDLILEVFGQTMAGERVSGSTRTTLDFCYSCGGCS